MTHIGNIHLQNKSHGVRTTIKKPFNCFWTEQKYLCAYIETKVQTIYVVKRS